MNRVVPRDNRIPFVVPKEHLTTLPAMYTLWFRSTAVRLSSAMLPNMGLNPSHLPSKSGPARRKAKQLTSTKRKPRSRLGPEPMETKPFEKTDKGKCGWLNPKLARALRLVLDESPLNEGRSEIPHPSPQLLDHGRTNDPWIGKTS